MTKKEISINTEWWTQRLAWPVIAATVIRFALLVASLTRVGISAISYGDTLSYLEPGRNLLLHGRFVADGFTDVLRTPGYSFFIAITSLGGLPMAAVANVILSVLSVLLVRRLGRLVFGDDRVALGAAWIFAFEPITVANSVLLLSDTLYLALLLLSLERLATFLHGRCLRILVVAGLWLTAATFVRPVSYYLPAALALGLFLVFLRVPGLRWKAPTVLLISVLPWLAAWQIRNWVEAGYAGFSSAGEYNLYYFSAAEVMARVENRNYYDVRRQLGYVGEFGVAGFNNHSQQQYLFKPYLTLHPEQAGWNQGQRLAFLRSEAVRVIRANTGIYLRCCIITPLFKEIFTPGAGHFDHLLNLVQPPQNVDLINIGPVRMALLLAKSYPWVAFEKAAFEAVLLGLYLLAVRGMFLVARGTFRDTVHNASLWLLLGTSLYFLLSAVAGGTGSEARYRLQFTPIVCILAAAGFRADSGCCVVGNCEARR